MMWTESKDVMFRQTVYSVTTVLANMKELISKVAIC
jgi:hypothetical protein